MAVKPAPADANDLAEALRDGRPEAFEQLYARLHARVFNLAARIVQDPDDAADITQDVFVSAFTGLPGDAARLRPEAWVYRVTVNACYDHLRRAARRQACSLPEDGGLVAAGDAFEQSELTGAVETALQALSPRYRAVLVLKDLHGLDTGEVAEVMGTTNATARVVLFRARSAFRRAFRGTAPAGSVTALGLAAFLPVLPVPPALQAPPSFAGLTPAGPIVVTPPPVPPVALLAKAGSALGAKAAMVAAAAAIVAGGGIAVEHARTDAPAARTDTTAAGVAAAGVTAPTIRSSGHPSAGRPADRDRTRRGIADARATDPGSGTRRSDAQGPGADGAQSGGAAGAGGQANARQGDTASGSGGTVDGGGSDGRSTTGSGGAPAGGAGGGQDGGGDSPGAAGDGGKDEGERGGGGTQGGGGGSST